MATSPLYAPNEPHDTIVQEKIWFQGLLLSNLIFGVEAAICFLAFLAVLQRRDPDQKRMRAILLVFIVVLFAFTAVAQGLSIDWIQMGFITQRNYPGGPSAFLDTEWSIPANLGANVSIVFANWMMECLFVWRCRVVCSAGGRLWWLGVAIPLLLLTGVVVSGCIFIYQTLTSVPTTTCFLTYGFASLALNVTATGIIAGRLLYYRHRVVSRLGGRHGDQYVGIAAIIIESAAAYTCSLLIVIITYATNSPGMFLLQQVIVPIQAVTSLLIIWRIARGDGWRNPSDREVVLSSPTLRVRPPSQHPIQLEAIVTQPDDEEGIIRRKGDESKDSFPRLSGVDEV